MRNPQLIFPRTFRIICEQPIAEGNPPTMFLIILLPQDTPHDYSHAHQMALKLHPDREIDLNTAYQRVHENAPIATTSITIVGKLAFLCLSLLFGTTPAPV